MPLSSSYSRGYIILHLDLPYAEIPLIVCITPICPLFDSLKEVTTLQDSGFGVNTTPFNLLH